MADNEKTASKKTHSGEPGERVLEWIQAKKRPLTLGAGAVALIGGSVWFMQSAQTRKEAFASNALQQARFAAESGNLSLAASDLGRLITDYSGTRSGADGTILLARVHLQQGNAETAISELRAFLNAGPPSDFRSPAQSLLGTALEETAAFAEASRAFEAAATESNYPYLRAQLLVDAARTARLAGDNQRAIALYDRILSQEEDSPAANEAKLRRAEIASS